jgi:hypothetical protein
VPAKRLFTATEDNLIIAARADRVSWADIALRIGDVVRDTVRVRGMELGLSMRGSNGRDYARTEPVHSEHREPLPAHHPVAWSAIERALNDHRRGYP